MNSILGFCSVPPGVGKKCHLFNIKYDRGGVEKCMWAEKQMSVCCGWTNFDFETTSDSILLETNMGYSHVLSGIR